VRLTTLFPRDPTRLSLDDVRRMEISSVGEGFHTIIFSLTM